MSTTNSSSNAAIPSKMSAVRIHKTGGADVLQLDTDVEVPKYGDKQVLIEVAYSGINFIDTYQRTGLYPLQLPTILGREGSGIVRAVGSAVKNVKTGDRIAWMSGGTYAQYAVTDETSVIQLPTSVSLRDAAASVLQGLTAYYLVSGSYPIQKGDTVLVHAAAGGTGALVVQAAKLRGATVIGTAGSADKCAAAKELGADHVINYVDQDFQAEVKRITNGKGVRAVYDGVGKATWEKSMLSLGTRGYLICFGNASGPVPPIDPLLLMKNGSLYVQRPTLNDFVKEDGALKRMADELFGWIGDGKVKIRVAREFTLKDGGEAHKYLESRQSLGKILLVANSELK